METAIIEIWGKFDKAMSCDKLLYAPADDASLTARHTRRYVLEYEGQPEAMWRFVQRTLLDKLAQESRTDGESVFEEVSLLLEVGIKRGVLDLEKEAILSYYRSLPDPGFVLKSLRIFQRYYIFGGTPAPERFIKDLVNPAIQNYKQL